MQPVLLHAAVKAAMTKHEEVAEKTKLLYKEHSELQCNSLGVPCRHVTVT
jgi:hypothetical protein